MTERFAVTAAACAGTVTMHHRVHVRYEGSDSALVVPFGGLHAIVAGFEAAYRQRFAFLMEGKSMMVEAVSVEAVVAGDAPAEPRHEVHALRTVPRRVKDPTPGMGLSQAEIELAARVDGRWDLLSLIESANMRDA